MSDRRETYWWAWALLALAVIAGNAWSALREPTACVCLCPEGR